MGKAMMLPVEPYPIPKGAHAIPPDELDLRPDAEIDAHLLHPPPVPEGHEKNLWFFWDSGYENMHPYAKRTLRAYHRRFSRSGWTIRLLSLRNLPNFLDTTDPTLFPAAFRTQTITGTYSRQHTSDLVRWPLLLRYGGVYADVGLMPIGDLDRLWNATLGNSDAPWEVISYTAASSEAPDLQNYFLAARPHNPLFARCHALFLALWAEDGGRTSTDGMHRSRLLAGLPLRGSDGENNFSPEVQVALSDYIIQGQAMRMVMGTVDADDGWDGPKYVAEHVYAIEFMEGSQLINEMTAWNGRRAFEVMSLSMPKDGEIEDADQRLAREIVEACLAKSFAFKLAHGLILAVLGDTLGSLWRAHEGSDDVPGTYAHWMRYGMIRWAPDDLSLPVKLKEIMPYKRGPLLEVVC